MNYPRIQVTLEGMRTQLLHAFSQYETEWTEMMREAVKAELTPERVAALVHEQVQEQLHSAVRDYVGSAIRNAIQPVIEERLQRIAREHAQKLIDRLYGETK